MDISRRIPAMLRTAAVWGAAWSVPGLVWVSVLAFLTRNSSPQVGLSGFVWTILLNWTVRTRSSPALDILAGSVYGLLGAVSAGASLHLARRVDPASVTSV